MHIYFRLHTVHCLCKHQGLALGLVGLVLGLELMLELELVVAAACRPPYDTIRYEKIFNVRSKAGISQLNLPHGTKN